MVESVASKYADRLKAVKMNAIDNMEMSSQYGIFAVPTLMFFKQGKLVNQVAGFQNESALTSLVEKVIA